MSKLVNRKLVSNFEPDWSMLIGLCRCSLVTNSFIYDEIYWWLSYIRLVDSAAYLRELILRCWSWSLTSVACVSSIFTAFNFFYFIVVMAASASNEQSCIGVCWTSDEWRSTITWRGTVVELRSLAGELSLSCARSGNDGWPLNVGKPSATGQPTRPT